MREAIAVHQRQNCSGEGTKFLPTRLLDLGNDAADKKRIHLILREKMSDIEVLNAKYATLSYCWGDTKAAQAQSKTTCLNLEERLDGINLDSLSPVIQDAIEASPNNVPEHIHAGWLRQVSYIPGLLEIIHSLSMG